MRNRKDFLPACSTLPIKIIHCLKNHSTNGLVISGGETIGLYGIYMFTKPLPTMVSPLGSIKLSQPLMFSFELGHEFGLWFKCKLIGIRVLLVVNCLYLIIISIMSDNYVMSLIVWDDSFVFAHILFFI